MLCLDCLGAHPAHCPLDGERRPAGGPFSINVHVAGFQVPLLSTPVSTPPGWPCRCQSNLASLESHWPSGPFVVGVVSVYPPGSFCAGFRCFSSGSAAVVLYNPRLAMVCFCPGTARLGVLAWACTWACALVQAAVRSGASPGCHGALRPCIPRSAVLQLAPVAMHVANPRRSSHGRGGSISAPGKQGARVCDRDGHGSPVLPMAMGSQMRIWPCAMRRSATKPTASSRRCWFMAGWPAVCWRCASWALGGKQAGEPEGAQVNARLD